VNAMTVAAILASAGLILLPTQAMAATPDVTAAAESLTVVQTSVVTGLAPGVAPVAIVGLITNNGPNPVEVTVVEVTITSVTPALDAAPGVCGPSDYVLLNARMPVNRTIEAGGGSTEFSGASIGFITTSANQDACQRATVQLLYTALLSPAALPTTGLGGGLGPVLMIALGLAIAGALLALLALLARLRRPRGWPA